jgi:choline dehydrogenase-like flavoprotein
MSLNLYQDSEDLASMMHCLDEVARHIHKAFGGVFEAYPGLDTTLLEDAFRSDPEPNAYQHFVSGCPIGSVVDAKLRVFGIETLRVIGDSQNDLKCRTHGISVPYCRVHV